MAKLHISFYGPFEELAIKRANQTIKNIMNVVDMSSLQNGDKPQMRKVILDEVNGLRQDLINYVLNIDKDYNGET